MSEELLQEQRAREEAITHAEADLIEQLQQRGQIAIWNKVRDRLHCERFLESRTGKRVYERLVSAVLEAQESWLLSADPLAPECVEAHRRARAAHMAIFALDEILQDGGNAERDLDQIALELGE